MNSDIDSILDGDYKVIYSGNFNIYDSKLILSKIGGFDFEFEFRVDPQVEASISVNGDNGSKKINVVLINFSNTLGRGTTERIPVINTVDNQKIYFSLYGTSVGDNKALNLTVTLYIK
ncbi:MAG TPA: hypothetical protein VKC89_03255 [Patescibacteria group bacterium]|nr:hypothetical protein [Patescibacteria group bacterium]